MLRQRQEGYEIAAISEDGQVAACIGYRLMNTLAWGKIIYVDDLITREHYRGRGYADQLLKYVINKAKSLGCDQIHLDTGYTRHAVHKVYLNHGFTLSCHHLSLQFR